MDPAPTATARPQWHVDTGRGMQHGMATEGGCSDTSSAVTCISARQLFDLVLESRHKPSPDAKDVFPWLYGISPLNETAAYFLRFRYPGMDLANLLAPPQISTGILLVKFGDPDNLLPSIKGSIEVQDIMAKSQDGSHFVDQFLETDMVEGLQLRNFAIQSAKFARICDIVLYSAHPHYNEVEKRRLVKMGLVFAELINQAQAKVGLGKRTLFFPGDLESAANELTPSLFSSLLVEPEHGIDPFDLGELGRNHSINWENGLPLYEQDGIVGTTAVSEVLPRFWLGNFISMAKMEFTATEAMDKSTPSWRTKVLCDLGAEPPTIALLDSLIRQSHKRSGLNEVVSLRIPRITDFTVHDNGLDTRAIAVLITLCKLLFIRSEHHASILMSPDGYHVASPFAVLYVMYSTGKTLCEALLYLHNECRRPLSFSKTELNMIQDIETIVYAFSPIRYCSKTQGLGAIPVYEVWKFIEADPCDGVIQIPPRVEWLDGFPGTFPSRILDHLYLGSFEHANNPGMLRALGIERILSVGERLDWLEYPIRSVIVQQLGFDEILYLTDLQDDGVDSLLPHVESCLSFLAKAEQQNQKTLVHCRKGVSRSAAVCIAEVMRSKGWGLPQAYAHVRIHRLDVLIQPNLRLMYDLLKFEEQAPFLQGRTTDWPVLSREITRLNGDYEL